MHLSYHLFALKNAFFCRDSMSDNVAVFPSPTDYNRSRCESLARKRTERTIFDFEGRRSRVDSGIAGEPWYAVHVRKGFERVAAMALRRKGYELYLPVCRKMQRIPGVAATDAALFPGYFFGKFPLKDRASVLLGPGVISVVMTAIPEQEIAAVRRVIESGLDCQTSPLISIGDLVVVQHGPLSGLTGRLRSFRGKDRLVISVQLLQRSVIVEVDRNNLRRIEEPLNRTFAS